MRLPVKLRRQLNYGGPYPTVHHASVRLHKALTQAGIVLMAPGAGDEHANKKTI